MPRQPEAANRFSSTYRFPHRTPRSCPLRSGRVSLGSTSTPTCDAVDAAVGQILASLESNGLADDTLVIFTSDNGCSPVAKYPELLAKGHDPSAGVSRNEGRHLEGGHHVPFIVRWPQKVNPGTISDQVICLTDLFSTCAEILGSTLPDTAAEDSISFLPALLGTASAGHPYVNSASFGQWFLRDPARELETGTVP